ncbi:hypothetical protein Ddye_027662 [Dipteronia dyeriana]|uniref:Cation/H+ exchanger transmembrane domain-containing protein n=1 Tax=Dipteronia dyeriana TaxID=168575 RepID=A0AAD9TPZ8_9ROSI|nr:hypothetical protein Ddye_027662 [Dipteronia dyeriana]
MTIDNRGEHSIKLPLAIFPVLSPPTLCCQISCGGSAQVRTNKQKHNCHLFEENRWVNESITAIFIGFISGVIILWISKWKSPHILRFSEELFFVYLLPPIIFNAGFQVKKKRFFHNFLTIMMFGIVGAFISVAIIIAGSWQLFPKLGFTGLTARDYLAIGTIFSSTDTVCTLQVLHQDETPLLYSIVFGEGVVNDATSVVLFNAIQKIDVRRLTSKAFLLIIGDFAYLFTASTALGVSVSTDCEFHVTFRAIHSSVREVALMVLMAYLSYTLAEVLELSGILTVFFCGIFMSHYAWHNVTDNSRISTRHFQLLFVRHVFAMLSFIAETFIFLYVGMDVLDIEKWKLNTLSIGNSLGIYGILILMILVGRAAFVFPLSALSNYMNRGRSSSITFKQQVVIWWAGIMRGAVSIALAFKQFTYSGVTWDPINATMLNVTIVVVLITTMVFGFLTKPLVNYLLPSNGNNSSDNRSEPKSPKEDMTPPLLSLEESTSTNLLRAKDSLSLLIERPVYTIHSYWRRFDDNYMRPIFGGANISRSAC